VTDRIQISQKDIDSVLMWSVIRAARRAGHIMAEALEGHSLNPVQFGVLAQLAAGGTMTQAELARATLVRPQSMSPLLQGMEDMGLISRSPLRERGRPNPVELTSVGDKRLREAWQSALNTNDLGHAGIAPTSSQSLNSLLLQIVNSV
jgi:DNA-binding MarR family transcriptional regulator